MIHLTHVGLFVFLIAVNNVCAERIKDMIYESIDDVAACFRRHNGTHQFGCSSSRSGSVGVIHLLENAADLKWLEEKGTAGPYTVIMPFSMFNRETLTRLKATNNINGILLARNDSETIPPSVPVSYSPEDTCPNRYSGIKSCNAEKPWNPVGNSFLMEDWPFPMFYMQANETLLLIKDCFWKHNAWDMHNQAKRSLCALEMKSFMNAALNSESCLRRSTWPLNFNPSLFCEPLADRNIHWPLGPLTDDTESVIFVTARLDANSMFDGLAPAANSAVTGMATLLATANYLNSLNATVGKKNVIFSLLNGEAFDYIGSSRLAYDLKAGSFNAIGGKNLGIDKITAVIELGQLGGQELYLHANNDKNNPLIDALKKTFELNNFTLDNSVPPASIQSFLSVKSNLTAVVLATHGEQFTNKYYHSLLDDEYTLKNGTTNDLSAIAKFLSRIAIKLGDTLYTEVTNQAPPKIDLQFMQTFIDDALNCYLVNSSCPLFRAASSPGTRLPEAIPSLYIGVARAPNVATTLTGYLLVLLTGIQLPNMTASQCTEKRFSWMSGYDFTGLCINSTVNFSAALSPAFIIDGYNMKSGKFSTWTESAWSMLSVRMFLKAPAAAERLSIILGSLVASLSFIVIWFVNSRADLLFENRRIDDC